MKAQFVRLIGLLALVLLAGCGAGADTPTAVATSPAASASTATLPPAATATHAAAVSTGGVAQGGCTAATPNADVAGKPLTKVVVAMGYVANVQFAPFYV